MAHLNQYKFCERVASIFPNHFENIRVLDVGSMDINGNNKPHFKNCDYIGLDIGHGPNVDIVCSGHLYSVKSNSEKFHTIISTECFEHDEYYKETITNIVENLLLPGGMFIFTCATIGRQEHGTTRTSPADSPFTNDYYKNLSEDDIKEFLDLDYYFSDYSFSTNTETQDLYFWGIKKREKVDAVILTNSKRLDHFRMTKESIISLKKSSFVADFNIILVEDYKESIYADEYKKLGCNVVYNNRTFSFSNSINYGLKHCANRYVCLMNNDIVLTKDWFDNIYFNLDKDPNICVYSSLDPYLYLELPENTTLVEGYKPTGIHSGWCHVIDTELLKDNKFLSEDFDIWYMDDDFCMRLQKMNLKQVLVKDSIVYHLGTSSINLYNDKDSRIGTDKNKFVTKYSNDIRLQSCLFYEDRTIINFESFDRKTFKFSISGDASYEATLNLEQDINYYISVTPALEIILNVYDDSNNLILNKKIIKYAKD